MFLTLTRENTLAAVKAALDAAAPLPGGAGITAAGGVAAFTDAGTPPLEYRRGDLASAWPTDGSAPYASIVTPEDDDGVFSIGYGAAQGASPAALSDRLLIDGALFRVLSVQIPGTRPGSLLRVGAYRFDPVVDFSGRSVEVATPSKARVARGSPTTGPVRPPAGLAAGVVRIVGRQRTRNLRHSVAVWDTAQDRWEYMPISVLLGDLIEGVDTATRYAAIRVEAGDAPIATFSIAEMEAGTSVMGIETGLVYQTFADPLPDGMFIRLAIGVPTGDSFPFLGIGQSNNGFNQRGAIFPRPDPFDTITLTNGEEIDIHVSRRAFRGRTFRPGFFAYFAADSINP